MSCRDLDHDLLMLAHRQLESAKALRVRAHLALCPACRARLRRIDSLSASLAQTLANPRLGQRSFARPARLGWGSLGFLAVLFTLLGLLVSRGVAASGRPLAPPALRACPLSTAPPVTGCLVSNVLQNRSALAKKLNPHVSGPHPTACSTR